MSDSSSARFGARRDEWGLARVGLHLGEEARTGHHLLG